MRPLALALEVPDEEPPRRVARHHAARVGSEAHDGLEMARERAVPDPEAAVDACGREAARERVVLQRPDAVRVPLVHLPARALSHVEPPHRPVPGPREHRPLAHHEVRAEHSLLVPAQPQLRQPRAQIP
eukprot:600308-Rhodomonas_salina.4